jgi:hypothetical protein
VQDPSGDIPEDSALLALLANVLDTVVDANEHAYQQVRRLYGELLHRVLDT